VQSIHKGTVRPPLQADEGKCCLSPTVSSGGISNTKKAPQMRGFVKTDCLVYFRRQKARTPAKPDMPNSIMLEGSGTSVTVK
jgi:hypothetical protein